MKKAIYLMITLSLLLVGCADDQLQQIPDEEKVYEVLKLDGAVDAEGKEHEDVYYYEGTAINYNFTEKTSETSKELWRQAIRAIEEETCFDYIEIYPVEEVFTVGEGFQKGDILTIQGNTANRVAQYVTRYDVPGSYTADYGDEVIHRHFSNGNLRAINDHQFVINFDTPFKWDEIAIKYISDTEPVDGQNLVGLEGWYYNKYQLAINYNEDPSQETTYYKDTGRNERLQLSGNADSRFPYYSSLGKTDFLQSWAGRVHANDDIDVETRIRLLAYNLGDEGAAEGAVDFDFLRSIYCE